MSAIINLSEDPFATAIDQLRPPQRLVMHGDIQMIERARPPRMTPEQRAAHAAALDRALGAMADAGRRAPNWFGDRRPEWMRHSNEEV